MAEPTTSIDYLDGPVILWRLRHRDYGRQLVQFTVDPKTGEQCPPDQRNAVDRRMEVYVSWLELTPHTVTHGLHVGYDKQGKELYADVVRPAPKRVAQKIERWAECDAQVADLTGDAPKARAQHTELVLGQMMLEALVQMKTFEDRLAGEREALKAKREADRAP